MDPITAIFIVVCAACILTIAGCSKRKNYRHGRGAGGSDTGC